MAPLCGSRRIPTRAAHEPQKLPTSRNKSGTKSTSWGAILILSIGIVEDFQTRLRSASQYRCFDHWPALELALAGEMSLTLGIAGCPERRILKSNGPDSLATRMIPPIEKAGTIRRIGPCLS
jgi:hypothetical protein